MELYVIRHARAADGGFYGEDGDRPLTPEGRQHAADLGHALARHNVRFDDVVTSPYVRAGETAELVLVGVGQPEGLRVARELLPEMPPALMLHHVIEPALAEGHLRLAIVGHEPSLGALLSLLLQRRNVRPSKGACVALQLTGDVKARRADLLWVMTPHQLEPTASLDIL